MLSTKKLLQHKETLIYFILKAFWFCPRLEQGKCQFSLEVEKNSGAFTGGHEDLLNYKIWNETVCLVIACIMGHISVI